MNFYKQSSENFDQSGHSKRSMNFKDISSQYKEKVNQEINNFFQEKPDNKFLNYMYESLQKFVVNGGKRLRPLSLIMAYNAVSEPNNELIKASLCVELFHASTLIHDDIMDEDTKRRGNDTIFESFRQYFLKNYGEDTNEGVVFDNKSTKYAVNQAIIAGNMLNSLCYKPILSSNFSEELKLKVMKLLSKSYEDVNLGQYEDVDFESRDAVSEEDYLRMISHKTGRLIEVSIQIGLVLANANEEVINSFIKYAKKVALAFQLKDDLMDISKDSLKGHKLGSDIKEGKRTLLIIKGLELASEDQKELLKKQNPLDDEVLDIIHVLKDCGSVDYVLNLANKCVEEAKEELNNLDIKSESKIYFEGLADFIINRNM